jgi:hypothetical protein
MTVITRSRAAAIRWASAHPAECDGGWTLHLFAAGDITEQQFLDRCAGLEVDTDAAWQAVEIACQSRVTIG